MVTLRHSLQSVSYTHLDVYKRQYVTSSDRIEKNLVEAIPLREALINAVVHNEFSREIPPVFEIFSDRMEFTSFGGLIPGPVSYTHLDTGYGLLRHVLVKRGFATGQVMVVIVTGSPMFPSRNNFVKALLKEHPQITTIIHNINDKRTSMVLGEREKVLYGKGYICLLYTSRCV